MSEQQTSRQPASLIKALKRGFGSAWDSLGYVVGASLATFLVGAIVLTLMGLLSANVKQLHPAGMLLGLPALLAWWLCEVGIFYYSKKSFYYEHPAPGDTWVGICRLFWPAVKLFVVDAIISTVLVGDVLFFASAFKAKGSFAFAVLGMVSAYVAFMWLLMGLYHLALLVAQLDTESGPRVWVVLRKSFLLAADNPGFTVGLFVAIIAIGALCVFSVLGAVLLLPGVVAFLLTSSLRELYVKYGVIEEEPEIVEDKPWRLNI